MIGVTPSGMRAAFRRICSSDAARIISAVCIVGGCVALARVFGFTLCPLKRLTGVPCPTCGSTRAVVLLLRGDAVGAFVMQPLATAAVCLLPPAWIASRIAFGRRRTALLLGAAFRRPLFWWLCAAAIAANWAYVIVRGN